MRSFRDIEKKIEREHESSSLSIFRDFESLVSFTKDAGKRRADFFIIVIYVFLTVTTVTLIQGVSPLRV